LKEQLARPLAVFVVSILTQLRGRPDAERAAKPPLREIIDYCGSLVSTSFGVRTVTGYFDSEALSKAICAAS